MSTTLMMAFGRTTNLYEPASLIGCTPPGIHCLIHRVSLQLLVHSDTSYANHLVGMQILS